MKSSAERPARISAHQSSFRRAQRHTVDTTMQIKSFVLKVNLEAA